MDSPIEANTKPIAMARTLRFRLNLNPLIRENNAIDRQKFSSPHITLNNGEGTFEKNLCRLGL